MVMKFGKYKGKSLEDITYFDPRYVLWLSSKNIVKVDSKIIDLALQKQSESAALEARIQSQKDEEKRELAINFHNFHQRNNTLEYQRRGSDISNWYDRRSL